MADGEVIPDALRLQQALEVAGPERDSAPSDGAMRSVADEDETPDFYLAGTVTEEGNPAGWPDQFADADGEYTLPSGVKYIDGEGDVRRHEDGTVFHCGKLWMS